MFCLLARAEDNKPLMSRALLHNTVRIEIQEADGKIGVGTGFFYVFDFPEKTSSIPVIVTCWHVVSNATVGQIHFALAKTNSLVRTQDDYPQVFPNFKYFWIRDPDTNVDLAVMPIEPLIQMLNSQGKSLDVFPIMEGFIPTENDLSNDGVFQEVKFIGYPVGIWDQKNNFPVVRRGMTATDPTVDYDGRAEFLIDAAVFPGSSGSPVFVADEGIHLTAQGRVAANRFQFLGILYAVDEYDYEGKVQIVTIPTSFDVKVNTAIPANLGFVIKSNRLKDFKVIFEQIVKMQDELAKQTIPKQAPSPEKH